MCCRSFVVCFFSTQALQTGSRGPILFVLLQTPAIKSRKGQLYLTEHGCMVSSVPPPPPANHSIHQQRWAALFLFFSLNLEYGAAQMVVRWLAVRHARVPISARHPCSYEDMEKGHRVQSVIIQKKKKRLLGLPASHHNPRSLDQGQF